LGYGAVQDCITEKFHPFIVLAGKTSMRQGLLEQLLILKGVLNRLKEAWIVG